MTISDQATAYIHIQPTPKRNDMQSLHDMILNILPGCKLWFLDGKNETGKVVSNPNIGYGTLLINYAGGKTKEFYQIGMSANTTGISIYVMGLKDKTFLANTYAERIGKATISGYCIKFKSLADIHLNVLKEAIISGIQ